MGLNIIIIVLLVFAGWFVLHGIIDAKRVLTHNQDDIHWVAAAAITCLVLFIVTIILSSCNIITI